MSNLTSISPDSPSRDDKKPTYFGLPSGSWIAANTSFNPTSTDEPKSKWKSGEWIEARERAVWGKIDSEG